MNNETSDETSTRTPSLTIVHANTQKVILSTDLRRPSWENIYYGYPRQYDKEYLKRLERLFNNSYESITEPLNINQPINDFFKAIFSNYTGELNDEDASAARTSIAITASPMMKHLLDDGIKKAEEERVKNPNAHRDLNNEVILKIDRLESPLCGYNVIVRVDALKNWLLNVWGEPDIAMGPPPLRQLPRSWKFIEAAIKDPNGIFIITTPTGGYATLWKDRKVFDGKEYINARNWFAQGILANKVFFWKLEGGSINKCGVRHNKYDLCERKLLNHDCGCQPNVKETVIHNELGCCHYLEIRDKINSVSGTFGNIGVMLKKLWGRYEKGIKIHNLNYTNIPIFGYLNENSGENNPSSELVVSILSSDLNQPQPGVQINIYSPFLGLGGSTNDAFVCKPYQVIIHELFHNIDYLVTKEIATNSNNNVKRGYHDFRRRFAETIEVIARDLQIHERNEIYGLQNPGLTDIIAGGRSFEQPPDNATIYTRNISDWYRPNLITFKEFLELGIYSITDIIERFIDNNEYWALINQGGQNIRTTIDQQAQANDRWINVAGLKIFYSILATETLANMAAAAIVDHSAFIQMGQSIQRQDGQNLHSEFEKLLREMCRILKI